jgi:crotonobetainyl-CoA:carnitine CoA-transferase CaiB-like acyl-CoA transferase
MPSALTGMKVVDVTEHLAGPYCTMILGDLGAEVTKIERPGEGDSSRHTGPFVNGESMPFAMVNRNKRSVTVNLKDPQGVEIVRRMARTADIFVENHRPGSMARLGLSYEELQRENRGLIYASISGFGQTGPYRERGGFDLIAQGMSGLMSVTGEPGRPPVKAGFPVSDVGAGMWAVIAILAAVVHRTMTGEGQYVETSLFETPLSWAVWEAALYFATGEVPGPLGSAHRNTAPYQAFRCKDGAYINIGAGPQALWLRLCQALGADELASDPRFATNELRHKNLNVLAPLLQQAFLKRTSEEWLATFHAAGIPCGPINALDRVFADPQTRARAMVIEIEHPVIGRMRTIGSPVKMGRTPTSIRRPPPTLGQHTVEVLRELGYDDAAIKRLRAERVI